MGVPADNVALSVVRDTVGVGPDSRVVCVNFDRPSRGESRHVGHGERSRGVGPDIVAGHHVAGRRAPADTDRPAQVAADYVPLSDIVHAVALVPMRLPGALEIRIPVRLGAALVPSVPM